ncbi:MAG: GtrA family protein, partial [Deltaproteobacteria bacterium]|nr:GtrA family protein [Deltaproteobacteria bacterium]
SSNKIITFQNYYKNIPLQYSVFLIGALSALLLTYLQMLLLIDYCRLQAMPARMLVTFIMLFYNYAFHKYFTFGKLR